MTNAKPLVGIILSSTAPDKLAAFYRDILGIPFAMEQHGTLREHLECESDGVHYAVLQKSPKAPMSPLTPSFAVPDLEGFVTSLAAQGITPLHPILNIGDGKRVTTISDPDGNPIRLIQIEPM